MIFVIDIRVSRVTVGYLCSSRNLIKDLYNQPISKLVEFIATAYQENPNMSLEVFVHKAEKLQEDDKIGTSRL